LRKSIDVSGSLNSFKQVLEAKRSDLLPSASKRDEIRIENSPEDVERLHQSMNRELAIRHLDREAALLKSVEQALERIGTGAFGMCLQCEEMIPEKRLNAVPWAALCLHCQEKLDRCRAVGEPDEEETLLPAA
jgi:DnaK suppressor protein